MKAYILSIAGVILISTLVSVIAPSGKMGKFVKGISKLFLVVILISPFASWMNGEGFSFETDALGRDERYLSACTSLLSRRDEAEIAAYLSEEYGIVGDVVVSRNSDDFSYEKISVRITDFGINGEGPHIDILSKIGESLKERYGCRVEVS